MNLRRRASAAALGLAAVVAIGAGPVPGLAERVTTLTRATRWTQVAAIRLPFRTFHPQGMVRLGENFYLSAVEVRTEPEKYAAPKDGYDRGPGAGVGHLFKFAPDGRLLGDLRIGEGTSYHPGGIDYDGRWIWVPVSEYRPRGRAIVYRVDPATMVAVEAFRWADHIGAIVHDVEDRALHGVSWGSRTFYRWPLNGRGVAAARGTRRVNPAQYVDYQDCHYAGRRRMVCAGVGGYAQGPGQRPFGLGGIELVDLKSGRPRWQAPVELRAPSGRPMTLNPFWLEPTATGLRAWFVPDDDASTLFVYDAAAR